MRNLLLFLLVVFSITSTTYSQVGIGTTTPNASSALEIASTDRGLLMPRVSLNSLTDTATITGTEATGLIVYNTGAGSLSPSGFYYWDGTKWVGLTGTNSNDWSINGNSGTSSSVNFLGTTDNNSLIIKSFNTEKVRFSDALTMFNNTNSDYDLIIKSVNENHALYVDASEDLVVFGSTGTFTDNGNLFITPVDGYLVDVDYVADFDNGNITGTTIGIGSVEYIVDGDAETFFSNTISPIEDLTKDIGYEYSWDDVWADDYWNVSDIRYKKNIKPMEYGLKELMKLSTISYQLKQDPFQEDKIGVIAQEINEFIPEAAKTTNMVKTEENGYKDVKLNRIGVSYGSLVPVLIKSIQEQQLIIEELKSKLGLIESKINTP